MSEIGVSGDEWLKFVHQYKNNLFQSRSTMVDASFNRFRHFEDPSNCFENICR
ncbi:MAG TPA: hypothetical protein GX746_09155 [Bacteroidales bacterium]|nr:hypothetical protein [Bacteroidales bacterium]